jgi:hypothetical protein
VAKVIDQQIRYQKLSPQNRLFYWIALILPVATIGSLLFFKKNIEDSLQLAQVNYIFSALFFLSGFLLCIKSVIETKELPSKCFYFALAICSFIFALEIIEWGGVKAAQVVTQLAPQDNILLPKEKSFRSIFSFIDKNRWIASTLILLFGAILPVLSRIKSAKKSLKNLAKISMPSILIAPYFIIGGMVYLNNLETELLWKALFAVSTLLVSILPEYFLLTARMFLYEQLIVSLLIVGFCFIY